MSEYDEDDIETPDGPIKISTKDIPDEEKVHLFTIDDEKYYARKRVPLAVSMRATRILATKGLEAAQAFTAIEVLGEEAWDALCDANVPDEKFAQIMAYAEKVVIGPGKGRSSASRAERRSGNKRQR